MAISMQFISCIKVSPMPEMGLFERRRPLNTIRCSAAEFDAKVFRHQFMRRKDYNRTGFGHQDESLEQMSHQYASEDIIQKLKENGNEYRWGEVNVKLAEAYGFCWGVERTVRIAYEARKQFPTHTIWLTNEIIHNPTSPNAGGRHFSQRGRIWKWRRMAFLQQRRSSGRGRYHHRHHRSSFSCSTFFD